MFGIILPVAILIILLLAVIFVFEVWMFVHAVRNRHISDETRLLWLIGMLLLHPIIAIVYYFTDYKKRVK